LETSINWVITKIVFQKLSRISRISRIPHCSLFGNICSKSLSFIYL